jgi:hypothetical protein
MQTIPVKADDKQTIPINDIVCHEISSKQSFRDLADDADDKITTFSSKENRTQLKKDDRAKYKGKKPALKKTHSGTLTVEIVRKNADKSPNGFYGCLNSKGILADIHETELEKFQIG